jgi:L-cysteine S-thiosulfotransferase
MFRHFETALMLALAVVGASPSFAQSAMPTPEQERASLVQALQKKFPGTTAADWAIGYEGLSAVAAERVVAIPFTTDNATNSADVLAIGKKLWEKKFANGKGFASCFPNAGKRVAVNYPQFDSKTKQVVTLEGAINRCLTLHDEKTIDMTDRAQFGPLTAYLRSLSEGQRLAIRVGGADARDRFDSGRRMFSRRMGQQDLACASCHVQQAGKLYGDKGLSAAIGQALNWPRIEPGGAVITLHMQFQRCMRRTGAEAFTQGSDEFNNLEYYLTYLSNGLTLRVLATQR